MDNKTRSNNMITSYDMSHTGKGYHIGYWKTNNLNDPRDLPYPDDFIDENWDPVEKEAVATYLDSQPDVEHWKGYSFCRLGCNHSIDMGTTDKSDGIFTYPAGFSHYIRVHNVRPPQEFIDHVLGRTKISKVSRPKKRIPCVYPLEDWAMPGARARVVMEHGQKSLPAGTIVVIHSFYEDDINIEVEGQVNAYGEPLIYHYMRGDFAGLFESV